MANNGSSFRLLVELKNVLATTSLKFYATGALFYVVLTTFFVAIYIYGDDSTFFTRCCGSANCAVTGLVYARLLDRYANILSQYM